MARTEEIKVSKAKAEYLRGLIEGLMAIGENCDWEHFLSVMEEIKKEYNELLGPR